MSRSMRIVYRSLASDRDQRFVRVASLDELRAKRMIVVKGERCPILVVCHGDRVFALDNRCPHLGFPLHRGSVADGISPATGITPASTLPPAAPSTLGPTTYPPPRSRCATVRCGWPRRTRYADGEAHWRNRLWQGMEHNIGLVIAKAVFGLIGEGVDPRDLVREAVLFGTRHRDGWGAGLTVLTALGNLLPFCRTTTYAWPSSRAFAGWRATATERFHRGRGMPLDRRWTDPSTLERWLRDWVLCAIATAPSALC